MQNEMQRPAQTLNEQETALSVFAFRGNPVTFRKDNDTLMVNATEMAKDFGKLTKDWLSNKQTGELIATLTANRGIPLFELVQVKQGSPENGGGTWLHEDLAIVFAQWLSPEFYLWCNDRIKEMLLGERIKRLSRPRAARYKGFFEWQAQVRRYIRPEDKRAIADLYGCCISHVRKVMAGSTMSMPLARLISEYAHENYKQGIRADLPSFEFQPMLFSEAELEGCMLNA